MLDSTLFSKFLYHFRDFFYQNGFSEIMCPPLVQNPGMEIHIHPFKVYKAHGDKQTPWYLHTSPEFYMKKVLSQKNSPSKIYTIGHSFRDEPESPIHRPQFIMCEWYRKDKFYTSIMDDCEKLVSFLCRSFSKNVPEFKKMSVNDLFLETLGFSILDYLDRDKLIHKIKTDFKDVTLPDCKLSWDDAYFLLFLNKVEPLLAKQKFVILHSFPHHLRALSTINEKDPRVCDRFELYLNGVEIANCFNELIDLEEQKKRFKHDALQKKKLYNYSLPEPTNFYQSLEAGLPASCGIALGVQRLYQYVCHQDEIFNS